MAAIDPTERTVDELRKDVQDVDDPDELRDILDAEENGDDRKSAKEAIERRIEECEESDESETDDGSDGDGTENGDGEDGSEDRDAEDETDGDREENGGDEATLIDVRNKVRDSAADLIGRRLDGISGIQRTDDGWAAIVNMIERRSVPDTQDILGRYEITFSSSGEIEGYRRLSRYRRGDTTEEDWQ